MLIFPKVFPNPLMMDIDFIISSFRDFMNMVMNMLAPTSLERHICKCFFENYYLGIELLDVWFLLQVYPLKKYIYILRFKKFS